MIKFVNNGVGMKTVHFKDGSAQFLKRGETITTSKAVARVDKGIKMLAPKKKVAVAPTEES